MTVRKTVGTVGTLAHGAISTAASVAKHPIGTAALAAGLVKGATEASVDLVRSTFGGSTATAARSARVPNQAEAPDESASATVEPESQPEPETQLETESETQAETQLETQPGTQPESERADLPGPDIVAAEVPAIDELPEPIVIEAEPAPVGEAFHTEPKAASRESDHGGPAGDREEAEGYLEEIPTPEEEPVWTSETLVDDEVVDEAAIKAVLSEAEILQKAADPHKE